jgi:hypothetical protein
MKSLTVAAVVVAGLVGACSSEQQQSARDDQQVNVAQLNALSAANASPGNPQHAPTGMPLGKTLMGPCCQP